MERDKDAVFDWGACTLQPSGGGTGKLRYESEPCGGFLKKQLLKPDRGRRIHIEVPMLRILIYLHPAAQTTRGSTATPEQRRELRVTTMS
jgi:hypothetical protein